MNGLNLRNRICWTYGVGFALAGLWCLLSLPFGGGGWVILLCGLKLVTGCVGSGPLATKAKVNCCLCPTQGQLVWAAKWSAHGCHLCWFWGFLGEAKLQRLTAGRAGLRLLSKSYGHAQARCYLFEVFGYLRDFRNIHSLSHDSVWKIHLNWLRWSQQLNETGFQGITRVEWTAWVR